LRRAWSGEDEDLGSGNEGIDVQGTLIKDDEKRGKERYLRERFEGLGYDFKMRRAVGESVSGLVEAFMEEVEILVMEKRLGGWNH
jgi:hypothetical protein